MSIQRKPPRLWLRSRNGKKSYWVIKDGGEQHFTGCGVEDSIGAERALAEYIEQKWSEPELANADLPVSDVLSIYGREYAGTTADPERIGYAMVPLLEFWKTEPVSAIKGESCRRYMKWRDRAPATVRRELGTLRAAINYCRTEGYLLQSPSVWLPEKPAPKDRWLSRTEVASLLAVVKHEGVRARHLRRFILLALYTGTRKDALLNLQWEASDTGGHVDLKNGVIYRQSAKARRTKKRQTPVRVPRRLLCHLRTWKSESPWVVEYRSGRVGDIKKSWNSARDRAGLDGITPHVLRHTAITWAMQNGARIEDASVFFAITVEELQRTYWHHHPDAQASVLAAFDG